MSDRFDIKIGTPGIEGMDNVKGKIHGLSAAASSFSAILSGQTSVANGLTHAFRGLYGSLGMLSIIGTIAVACYKLVTAMEGLIDKMTKVGEAAKLTKDEIANLQSGVTELSKLRLDELVTQMENLKSKTSDTENMFTDLRAAEKEQINAQADLAKAQVGASQGMTDEEKSLKVAEIDRDRKKKLVQADHDNALDQIALAKQGIREQRELKKELQSEADRTRSDLTVANEFATNFPSSQNAKEQQVMAEKAAFDAKDRLKNLSPVADKEISRLERTRSQAEAKLKVTGVKDKEADTSYEAEKLGVVKTMFEKQNKAEEEKQLKAIDDAKTAREKEYEDKKAELEGQIVDAGADKDWAKTKADAYKPSKNAKGKELKRQKEHDAELDASEAGAAAREAQLKKALKALEAENKKTVDALTEYAKTVREQNKNLPE